MIWEWVCLERSPLGHPALESLCFIFSIMLGPKVLFIFSYIRKKSSKFFAKFSLRERQLFLSRLHLVPYFLLLWEVCRTPLWNFDRLLTFLGSMCSSRVCLWRLKERLERLTGSSKVTTVLGSIPASSDPVESDCRQMKRCLKSTLKNPQKFSLISGFEPRELPLQEVALPTKLPYLFSTNKYPPSS